MEEKNEEEIYDHTRYTEVDFSWPEEIKRRARNIVKEFKIMERAKRIENIRKSNINKDSTKPT